MNFLDFLPIPHDGPAFLQQAETQEQLLYGSYASMESSFQTATDTCSTPASASTECPDDSFPLPSRAVMLIVRPRQPRLFTDRTSQPDPSIGLAMWKAFPHNLDNADSRRLRQPLSASDIPESFPAFASDLDSVSHSGRYSSPVSKDRSHIPLQDLDGQKIMNELLATHDLELVASSASPPPISVVSPRLSLQLYVKQPSLPTQQLPDDVDTDFPVRIQRRSEVTNGLQLNLIDTALSSHQTTPMSSLSLGPPITTPDIPHDTNEAQAYTILGTLNPGIYENKIAASNLETGSDQRLRVLKVMSKRLSGAQVTERELDVLKWLSEIASDEQQRAKNQMTGFNFLQTMTTSFENQELTFIVLEHHPASLTHPEIASRLRFQQSKHPAGILSSTVPPVTLSSTQSIPARLRAVRLLAAELVLGLLFLHDNGIVHHDIKPANVMISAAGHAVIGEFGAARRLPFASNPNNSTGSLQSPWGQSSTVKYGPIVRQPTESPVFTSLYSAPESIETNSDGMLVYDDAIDFWSLGVLLHEVATGFLPFGIAEGNEGDIQTNSTYDDKVSDPHLEIFVKELLIRDPRSRLRGVLVKYHLFFERIFEVWDDIASLKHPPLPRPLSSQQESTASPSRGSGATPTKTTVQETGSPPTQPRSTLPKSILKRRPTQFSKLDNSFIVEQSDSGNSNVIPEYIVPSIAESEADPVVCGNCAADLQASESEDESHQAYDSGLVMPKDIPSSADYHDKTHSRSGYDSPKTSASSSLRTPKSQARFSRLTDIDEELLLAAATCFDLEAYLSTGHYFNDAASRASSVHMVEETQIPFPTIRDRPTSDVSTTFDESCETQKQSFIEVAEREPPHEVSDHDNADWSFEDEITMAVLDAMNQKSPVKEDEFGVLASLEIPQTQRLSRTRQARNSIRRTFENFRRRRVGMSLM